jgi:hypothetical protein
MSAAELTGWFAYLELDDEVRANWTAYAIAKAFGGGKKDGQGKKTEEIEEEIFDTTDPDFEKYFQGFIYESEKPKMQQKKQGSNADIIIG